MEKQNFLITCKMLLFAPIFFFGMALLVNGQDFFFLFFETNIGRTFFFIGLTLYGSSYVIINRMKKSTLSLQHLHVLLLVPAFFILLSLMILLVGFLTVDFLIFV